MTSRCTFIVMIVTAYASAGVIPVPEENASSDLLEDAVPVHQHKTLAALIAELKALEIWRQNELNKALEDPELVREPDAVKYLQSLVEYDKRWFVYAVRILDCIETLDHPDGKTAEEIQQATDTVLVFRLNQDAIQTGISVIKATADVARDQVPDELLETHQMEVVTLAFQVSYMKLFEAFKALEAQTSQTKSIYSRNYVGSQLFRVLVV
ncbi:unnamed protein product [Bemisia tabaci]|uniref:Secreted protein n=1 Tax=Bemisia tabaci TaxID=7038 RepID=A0A9N9ZZT0_BEMTA|nr:unnamed protein product [Bemisia tabaci]